MALTKTPIELSSTPSIVDGGNATAITIDSSENVGIGTSSPAAPLDIQLAGTGTADIFKFQRSDGAVAGVLNYNGTDGAISLGTTTAHPLAFDTNNAERMRIDSSGLVTVGSAVASTNVEFRLNGVASKAQRIKFAESGVDKWLVGQGAASETDAFEIYNSNGQMSLSIAKATSAATFSGSVTATGGVYLGGTGAANKLEDYEEGTWTSLNEVTGSNCTNISHSDSYYTKVGRLVTLSFNVEGTITSSGAETSFKFFLPFTAINNTNQGAGGTANFLIGGGADRFGLGCVYNGTTASGTAHVYIPSDQMNASGAFTGMRVFMSYITT